MKRATCLIGLIIAAYLMTTPVELGGYAVIEADTMDAFAAESEVITWRDSVKQ